MRHAPLLCVYCFPFQPVHHTCDYFCRLLYYPSDFAAVRVRGCKSSNRKGKETRSVCVCVCVCACECAGRGMMFVDEFVCIYMVWFEICCFELQYELYVRTAHFRKGPLLLLSLLINSPIGVTLSMILLFPPPPPPRLFRFLFSFSSSPPLLLLHSFCGILNIIQWLFHFYAVGEDVFFISSSCSSSLIYETWSGYCDFAFNL